MIIYVLYLIVIHVQYSLIVMTTCHLVTGTMYIYGITYVQYIIIMLSLKLMCDVQYIYKENVKVNLNKGINYF